MAPPPRPPSRAATVARTRRGPPDLRGTTEAGLHDLSMEGCNDRQIGSADAVVAVNDGRQGQLASGTWRRAWRTKNRHPEVEVLVVLAQDDLGFAGAEDPEDADALGCWIT